MSDWSHAADMAAPGPGSPPIVCPLHITLKARHAREVPASVLSEPSKEIVSPNTDFCCFVSVTSNR